MNIVDPIVQGYIYSELTSSSGGGNTTTAGLPISKIVESKYTYGGGESEMVKRIGGLTVPYGIVLIKDDPGHKITYKNAKEPEKCDVISNDLFDKLIDMVEASSSSKKQRTTRKKKEEGSSRNNTKDKKKIRIKP